ncbi:MAG TPA: spermidine synthase [Thermoanaerobaculia bacterium]|jgi:spermidine synthase
MATKPILNKTWQAAGLLFFSGASALIYQTVWMRDFRLIFGASTVATGAVLAIFMGGLGLGSAILGRRADRHPHPLAFYGLLEMIIAASAAITPLLLMGIRAGYFAIGGSASLGTVGATLVRLLLSALVLAVPTILMGGTLPAMARAVESNDDQGRRRLALLYGINTLGAVFGALISTFVMLERFGNRTTLLIAAAVNLGIGALAYVRGKRNVRQEQAATEEPFKASAMPARLVLVAAALVGFAFLLMELVWYRMLSPLLGGTTFMFGLVLAIALAGIGIGGAIYSFGNRALTATATGFAITCTLEALFMIIPYALGDRIAIFANALRALRVFGFGGHIASWSIVTIAVVLPASIVAGYQFPLLISLLGRGRESVGREVGMAYAWNTGGSIAASLLGSFVLIPMLGARGSWKLAVAVLVALGAVTLIFAMRERTKGFAGLAAASAVISILLMFSLGPTGVWRHSGIGAGRAPSHTAQNPLQEWINVIRDATLYDKDGRESSIALITDNDLGLIVNGKSDGSARDDAGTQVMSGMLPMLIHPNPKKALVIGLGTGTTSGWIADTPGIERVDAVELEPVVIDIATYYNPVNRNAMSNPKHVNAIGDAREVLLTTKEKYDLIFSEPSNPYRAGIASLYTHDFYSACVNKLNPNGLFVQWMQMYSIDTKTMKTIYATISSVFTNVTTWTTTDGDIVLVASRDPIVFDADRVRQRLAQEPYRSAAHVAWRVESVEGILAHFIGSEQLAKSSAEGVTELNTDDRQIIEFSFARTLGRDIDLMNELAATAGRLGAGRPSAVKGNVDWVKVAENRDSMFWLRSQTAKNEFARKYASNDYAGALASWRAAPWQPVNSYDNASLGHVLANAGDDAALTYIDPLRPWQPAEADVLTGLLLYRKGSIGGAAALFNKALLRYREDPWPLTRIMDVGITTISEAARDPQAAEKSLEALSEPYVAYLLEQSRKRAFLVAAWEARKCSPATLAALREYEPNVPWRASVLQMRAVCYSAANLDLAAQARADLLKFSETELQSIAR